MYLPSLAELTTALVGAVRPGGIISLLTRNRAGIAMRAGMLQQWAAALAGFDATHYTNRLGIELVRADEPIEVQAALEAAEAQIVDWYGVRLFSDHWHRDVSVPDLDAVIAAERQASTRPLPSRCSADAHHRDGHLGGYPAVRLRVSAHF